MNEDLISIIIPVYNVELFIEDCILSVLNQTYKNLEIILINDGSTDNSGNICKKLSSQFSNIILINKNNEGVSAARNDGIKISKGKYLTFVDGDDILASDYIEKSYKFLKENNLMIVRNNYKFFDNGKFIINQDLNCSFLENNKNSFLHLIQKGEVKTYVWLLLIDRTLFDDTLLFDSNLKIYEDYDFYMRLFVKNVNFGFLDNDGYYYRLRIGSAVLSETSSFNMLNSYTVIYKKYMSNNLYSSFLLKLALLDIVDNYIFSIFKNNRKNFKMIFELENFRLYCDLFDFETSKFLSLQKRLTLSLFLKKNFVLLNCVLWLRYFFSCLRRFLWKK